MSNTMGWPQIMCLEGLDLVTSPHSWAVWYWMDVFISLISIYKMEIITLFLGLLKEWNNIYDYIWHLVGLSKSLIKISKPLIRLIKSESRLKITKQWPNPLLPTLDQRICPYPGKCRDSLDAWFTLEIPVESPETSRFRATQFGLEVPGKT